MKQEKKELKKAEEKRLKERVKKKAQRRLTLRQKTFAQLVPLSPSLTKAAVDAGYSRSSAHVRANELVKNSRVQVQIAKVERNLKEHLNAKGLDDENIAERIIDFINYNSEEVERGGSDGGKTYKEMRDSRGAATMLTNVVKFKGASLENTTQNFTEINNEIALLAIKNLIQKLSDQELRIVKQSVEALLELSLKIVDKVG